MDAQTFAFYLGQTPAEYAAGGPVTFERVMDDLLQDRRARDVGLAFLASELTDYLTAAPVVLLDGQSYRADDLTPTGLTGAELARRIADHMAAELGVTSAPAGYEARALALLRDLLTLYEGQRLAPPETFASYWQDVRALLRAAGEEAGNG